MNPFQQFLDLCGVYCRAAGIAEATLASRMLGDGKRLAAIRANSDMGVRRMARAMKWLSDNWPADAEWPDDVDRPERSVKAVDVRPGD